MPVDVAIPVESWTGTIREITIGATAEKGGTRGKTVTVGGASALPFLGFEGEMPHRPTVAVEISDARPDEWPEVLVSAWGDVVGDVGAWAAKAEEIGADLIALSLDSAHPERGNTGAKQARYGAARAREHDTAPDRVWPRPGRKGQ